MLLTVGNNFDPKDRTIKGLVFVVLPGQMAF